MEGTLKPRYRSDALEVLHETMSGLHRHGVIDTATMRHFDLSYLPTEDKPGTASKRITNAVSKPFA